MIPITISSHSTAYIFLDGDVFVNMSSHSSEGQGTAGSAARLVGGWGAPAGV